MQASTIIDSVREQLFDPAPGIGWTNEFLLGRLNEAMRATAFVKPDFYVLEIDFTLAAGVTQEIPADGVAVVNVVRNVGGSARVITQVDSGLLDEASRFWPAATQETIVEHFTIDPRNPRRFDVYPPSDGISVVDLVYGAVPPQVMYEAETLPVNDSYQDPLTNFVLAKAYEVNSKRQDLNKAAGYMRQWGGLLGVKSNAQIAVSPRVASSPGTT